MKLAINTLPLSNTHSTRGVGIYTKNLLEELRKVSNLTIQEFNDPRDVKEADIVHYPYFDLFQNTLPFIKKFKTVVTIHDVTPLVFPEHYPLGVKGTFGKFMQQLSLSNISGVITDSLSSKEDIIKILKVDGSEVFPVYLAASSDYKKINTGLEEIKYKYNLTDTFNLYVGNVNWNKNILGIVESSIAAGIDLYLVGKSFQSKDNIDHPELRSYKEFLTRYERHPLIHVLGYVEQPDLVKLMNLASVFLYPSFYEGFGMPVLEAQACGVPVITSNVSSLPEVARQGAILIDPHKTEELTAAIKKVLADKVGRAKLVKEGFENTKRFSWKKTAQETFQVYEQILSR